jgi:hypothetical protein
LFLVGDDEVVGGSGDGDVTPMMSPVVMGADQNQIVQLGEPAVLPVPDVMGMQTARRPAPGNYAATVSVLEDSSQPATDGAGRPS